MTEHKRIWLEPNPGDDPEGRTWCQHNIWDEHGVEYVHVSEIDRLQRENAELLPYKDELLRLAEAVGEKDDPFAAWEHLEPAIARAEAAEAEVKRLEQAIKNMTANKIGFTYEPTGERVTLYAPNPNAFEIIAKHPEILSVVVNTRKEIERRKALASTGGEHHAE